MLCAVELCFHFSERPLFEIEIKKYGKDEKHMLAQAVEHMYEVSTFDILLTVYHYVPQ
jgi:hypothetical protein